MDDVPAHNIHQARPPEWKQYCWLAVVFTSIRVLYRYAQLGGYVPGVANPAAVDWLEQEEYSCQLNLIPSIGTPAADSSKQNSCHLSKDQEVAINEEVLHLKRQFDLFASCRHYISNCCSPLLDDTDPCNGVCLLVRSHDYGKYYCALSEASKDQTCPYMHFDYSKSFLRLAPTTDVDLVESLESPIFKELHMNFSEQIMTVLFHQSGERDHRMIPHATPVRRTAAEYEIVTRIKWVMVRGALYRCVRSLFVFLYHRYRRWRIRD